MKKKIALMLILFMIGTWFVSAEEVEPGVIILAAVLIPLLIGGGIAIYLAASGDQEGGQRVLDSLALENSEKDISAAARTVMENPIVEHTILSFNGDNVFVGVRFAW